MKQFAPPQITGRTRVMFIMGDPIGHVVGTAVLNAAWQDAGRDLVTVPLHVLAPDLPHMLDSLRKAPNVAGTGITIPHKIAALSLVDHVTEAARLAGAVNFIRRNPDGSLTGHNIDGAGFLAGLAAHGIDPVGRSVHIAGAGGVARPIAFALAAAGAHRLTIRNRDMAKAEALLADIRASGVAPGCILETTPGAPADLLVNATSLGMKETDPMPFDLADIATGAIVAEVVMTPAETPLLAAARARGCTIVPGRAMMDPQAALVAAFLDGTPA